MHIKFWKPRTGTSPHEVLRAALNPVIADRKTLNALQGATGSSPVCGIQNNEISPETVSATKADLKVHSLKVHRGEYV